MDDLVTQLAADYDMSEEEVRAKVGPLLDEFGGGDRSSLLDQISERLGGRAATGPEMGELEGRMNADTPEGGIIGGLGSMLGQSRGNEEPHQTFQDVADEMAAPVTPLDEDRADGQAVEGYQEIDEADLRRGDENPLDGVAGAGGIDNLSEDAIINGLDAAERQGIEPAEDRAS